MIRAKRPREEWEAQLASTSTSSRNAPGPSSARSSSPSFHSTSATPLQPRVKRHNGLRESNSGIPNVLGRSSARTAPGPPWHASIVVPEAEILPENDIDIEQREDEDSLNEVVMAIDVRDRGNVGCCYYIAKTQQIAILSDVQGGGLGIVENCTFCTATQS